MANRDIVTMHEKNMQQVSAKQRVGKLAVKFFVYLFLIVMAVIVLFPFYWMIISSLKTLEEYRMSVPTFFPQKIMFSNYAEAVTAASLGRLFLNTISRSLDLMRSAGVDAKCQREENEGEICLTIRIPKGVK